MPLEYVFLDASRQHDFWKIGGGYVSRKMGAGLRMWMTRDYPKMWGVLATVPKGRGMGLNAFISGLMTYRHHIAGLMTYRHHIASYSHSQKTEQCIPLEIHRNY